MSSRLRNELPGKPLEWWCSGSGVLEKVCLRDAGTETLGETEEEVWHGSLQSSRAAGLTGSVHPAGVRQRGRSW